LATDRGYITSTPKSVIFSKKVEKRPKYERDSCMPGPKNGERPYLAVPETPFLGSVFWHFSATGRLLPHIQHPSNLLFSATPIQLYSHPNPTHQVRFILSH